MYIPKYKRDLALALKEGRRGAEPASLRRSPRVGELLIPSSVPRIEGKLHKRYFVRFTPTNEVFEITRSDYLQVEENRDTYRAYILTEVQWDSRSPKSTETIGEYIRPGSNYRNFLTIIKHRQDLPELFNLTVKDGTFINTTETPGQEFKTRDGRPFTGSYELTKDGEIYSLEESYSSTGRRRLYPIDKIFTEFDR